MPKKRLMLVLLVCLFTLSGCTLKFAYNHLDKLLPWYLDRYIELSDVQDDFLEQQIERHLVWHRTTQLPAYISTLQQFRQDMADGLTDEELAIQEQQWQSHWRMLVTKLIDDAAQLLLTSSDQQLQELKDNQLKSQAKFVKKYVEPSQAQRRKQHQEGMLEYFDDTLGDLTEQQNQAVIEWSQQLTRTDQARFEYRNTWLARFHQLLDERYSRVTFKEDLSALILNPQSLQPEALRDESAYNEQLDRKLWLTMDQLMTDQQRKQLDEDTLDLIDDLQGLLEG